MKSLTRVVKARYIEISDAAEFFYEEQEPPVSDNIPGAYPFNETASSENAAIRPDECVRAADSVDDAAAQADRIIEYARMQAAKIISDAGTQAKLMMEQAKKQGYQDGERGGLETAHLEIGEAVNEISALLHSLEEQKAGMLKEYEGKIRDLAIHIAKKVIQTEMDQNSDTLLNIYKSAVQELRDQEWIRLSVSDLQVQFATENADMLMSLAKGAKHIEIVGMPEAPKGTCIVETPDGIIDASLETQMDKIKEAFAGVEMLLEPRQDEDEIFSERGMEN